jgi:hypothetical protein
MLNNHFGNEIKRINFRESNLPKPMGNSKSMTQIVKMRKMQMINEQEEKFGNQVVGIHG